MKILWKRKTGFQHCFPLHLLKHLNNFFYIVSYCISNTLSKCSKIESKLQTAVAYHYLLTGHLSLGALVCLCLTLKPLQRIKCHFTTRNNWVNGSSQQESSAHPNSACMTFRSPPWRTNFIFKCNSSWSLK